MAAVGKEAERAELQKTIWRIVNDLRGSVDGCDFKAYVLGTLFYRFISENLTAYLNEQERRAGSPDFDYTALSDAEAERGGGRRSSRRASTSCPASFSRTCASGRATTRTSTRPCSSRSAVRTGSR
jgi:HsdM N-terminal domain